MLRSRKAIVLTAGAVFVIVMIVIHRVIAPAIVSQWGATGAIVVMAAMLGLGFLLDRRG